MLTSQLTYFPGGDAEMREARDLVCRRPGRHHNDPTRTFVVAGGHDKNVPLHVLSDVLLWAHRSLVLGGRGHEIQETLDDDSLETVVGWLRDAAQHDACGGGVAHEVKVPD